MWYRSSMTETVVITKKLVWWNTDTCLNEWHVTCDMCLLLKIFNTLEGPANSEIRSVICFLNASKHSLINTISSSNGQFPHTKSCAAFSESENVPYWWISYPETAVNDYLRCSIEKVAMCLSNQETWLVLWFLILLQCNYARPHGAHGAQDLIEPCSWRYLLQSYRLNNGISFFSERFTRVSV